MYNARICTCVCALMCVYIYVYLLSFSSLLLRSRFSPARAYLRTKLLSHPCPCTRAFAFVLAKKIKKKKGGAKERRGKRREENVSPPVSSRLSLFLATRQFDALSRTARDKEREKGGTLEHLMNVTMKNNNNNIMIIIIK